ncbi:hypothetical protein PMAYCL1PPCAC_09535 [Pristionchus mayeri]|uniref:Uncharacterized protein n=1 Tax=Pristionchus mayeri TaxID=1317129 RepID=A0AAN4ZKK7_9BILA|nr:hypothetical protein PMAYCL1PPCAC_09535 [Pristionchus mayeri]
MGLLSWVASIFSSEPSAPTAPTGSQTGASTRTSTSYAHAYSDNTYSTRPPPPRTSSTDSHAYSDNSYSTRPTPTYTPMSPTPSASPYSGLTPSTSSAPRPSQFDDSSDEEDELAQHFSSLSLARKEIGTPVYTLCVTNDRVCVFEPAREKFVETKRADISLQNVKENDIYHAESISYDGLDDLVKLQETTRKQYLDRGSFTFGSPQSYRELVLPALLLGSRMRDFEQRCAKVIQLGELILVIEF